MADKKLVQLEYDKFLKKDSAYDVSPIAVVNPDGSNISGGGGSNATVTIVGSIPAGTNQIGSVTVFGNLSASLGGNITLNTSPNFIGLVTTVPGAVQPINDNNGSITVDWASGATVSIATMPPQTVTVGNVTLNPGPNHIGSVTIFGTIQSSAGAVTLYPGPNQIGSVTISNTVNTIPQGNVTLNSSPNFIGLVTVGNIPSVAQSGAWAVGVNGNLTLSPVQSVLSLASVYGEVKVTNTVPVTGTFWQSTQPVSFNQLISLASGTEVKSVATIANLPATYPITDNGGSLTVDWISGATIAVSSLPNITIGAGNVTLNPSPNFIGLVTVANTVPVTGSFWQTTQPISFTGNATLNPSPNYIGLVTTVPGAVQPINDNSGSLTVDWLSGATVGVSSLPNVTLGSNVTLNSSNAFIGLATVVLNSNVTLSPIQSLLSLASIYGNVGIATGANFIGLATVVPTYISTYTSLATVISASGSATLFLPPSNQRWILKDLLVGSQGQTQVGISSGTVTIIPTIALATMGGYISNFGDSGIRGRAQNDSFVVVNNSAVTISVTANVRFDS